MSDTITKKLDEFRALARDDERLPMSRGVQFPTVHGRVLSLEQDLARTRQALREAIALLEVFTDE